jgi:hypothetical protein
MHADSSTLDKQISSTHRTTPDQPLTKSLEAATAATYGCMHRINHEQHPLMI